MENETDMTATVPATVTQKAPRSGRIIVVSVDGVRRPRGSAGEPPTRRNPITFDYGRIARSKRLRKAAAHTKAGAHGLFALTCSTVCCSFLATVVLVLLLKAVAISAIVIGGLHIHDCPAQPHIPYILVALGSLGLVIGALDLLDRLGDRRTKKLALAAAAEAGAPGEDRGLAEMDLEIVDNDSDSLPVTIKAPTCLTFTSSALKLLQLILFIYMAFLVFQIVSTVTYSPDPPPHPRALPWVPPGAAGSGIAGSGVHLAHGNDEVHYCAQVVYLFAFWFTTVTIALLVLATALLFCICMSGAVFLALSEL